MANYLTTIAPNGTYELTTNNAGTISISSVPTVIHDDVHAPGIVFGSGAFVHISTDLTPFGVDDSWAVQCTFISNDPGFDDCVIGQAHWDDGIGDSHIYNFGAGFTTTTPIRIRCIATKVA